MLMCKWILRNLEGIDIYWDGEVVGRRKAVHYFGRLLIIETPFTVKIIYDDTSELVEIPSSEWIKLSELNTINKDVLRQRNIREQLKSMNNMVVDYDENFFEKTAKLKFQTDLMDRATDDEKERIIKKEKMHDEEKVETQIKGTLKVNTLTEQNENAHGFKVWIENVVNTASNEKLPDIIFDTKEIYLNNRNFKNSNLNIILTMNKSKMPNDDALNAIIEKKKDFRKDNNIKRYTEEITLSTHFYTLVYANQDITLLEVFRYFARYEKRKVKLIPIYINYISNKALTYIYILLAIENSSYGSYRRSHKST